MNSGTSQHGQLEKPFPLVPGLSLVAGLPCGLEHAPLKTSEGFNIRVAQ